MLIRHLVDLRGWRIDLHKFIGNDDAGCFHTHPSTAIRFVLAGGYTEELESGALHEWKPLRLGLVPPELSHRVAGLRNGKWSYSLWLRSPKRHRIELRGRGWDRST